MFLAFLSPALALTVPLRVTFAEEVVPGESAVASTALTATVELSNPTTGEAFSVEADELTVEKREASGRTSLSFAGDPAGSLRTWAIHFLDVNGDEIADPEIVDVLFDDNGNGAIAARDTRAGGWLSAVTVSAAEAGSAAGARVLVADGGARAALIGIVELTNDGDGSRLYTNPDLEVLDAGTFAAVQALGLDAVVALDTYKVQLEGDLAVTGLAVAADGTVELGAELDWDLTFYDGTAVLQCQKGGACTSTAAPSGSAWYTSPLGPVRAKKAATPRVALKPADLAFDTWGAGFSFSIEGDVRDLELAASLEARDGDFFLAASDVISLDPGGFGVDAANTDDDDDDTGMIVDIFIDTDCEDCGDYDYTVPNPTDPPAWTAIAEQLIEVSVLDSAGGVVSTHTCTMRPTAGTQVGSAKTDTLVGACTRDVAGTEVRRLRAKVGPYGTSSWSIDMAGPAFAEVWTTRTCEKGVACGTTTVSVLGGTVELAVRGAPFLQRPLAVTSTEFDLPFSFASDVDALPAALSVALSDPDRALTWSEADGVLYGKDGDTLVHTLDLDGISLAPTGLYTLRGAGRFTASSSAEGEVLLIPAKALTLKR